MACPPKIGGEIWQGIGKSGGGIGGNSHRRDGKGARRAKFEPDRFPLRTSIAFNMARGKVR